MESSRGHHVRELLDEAAHYRDLADMCERMACKLALEGIAESDGDAVELALLALGRRPRVERKAAQPPPRSEPEPSSVAHGPLHFYDPHHSQEEPWEGFEMLPPKP